VAIPCTLAHLGCPKRALGGEVTVEFGVSGTKVEAVLPLEWAAVK
jgi:hypothetical protein